MTLRHLHLAGAGVRLHAVSTGTGPPVVLLHGFPDFWYSWRHQLPALAAHGFRAVAPDLRGYNRSDRPRGVGAYTVDAVADDIAAVIGALGGRAHVLGHDWGGVVAWHLAARDPALVDRLVVINAPHPARFARALRTPAQLARSWYVLFFQLPWLPERLLGARGGALLLRLLRRSARRGAFTADDLARYREAFAEPGAVRAAIDYYRAAARRRRAPSVHRPRGRIVAPTLVLWGMRDPALGPELTEGLEEWVDDVRVERHAEAGHWLHLDEPAWTTERILRFLGAPSP